MVLDMMTYDIGINRLFGHRKTVHQCFCLVRCFFATIRSNGAVISTTTFVIVDETAAVRALVLIDILRDLLPVTAEVRHRLTQEVILQATRQLLVVYGKCSVYGMCIWYYHGIVPTHRFRDGRRNSTQGRGRGGCGGHRIHGHATRRRAIYR